MGLDTFKTHFLFPLILKAFRHFFFAFFENMYRQNTDTMLERKLKKIDLEVGCLENILKKMIEAQERQMSSGSSASMGGQTNM